MATVPDITQETFDEQLSRIHEALRHTKAVIAIEEPELDKAIAHAFNLARELHKAIRTVTTARNKFIAKKGKKP